MKRKININRPQMSADEINHRKNFDSVLKTKPHIGAKALYKKPWFLSSVVVATVAIVTSIALLNQKPKTQDSSNNQQLTTTADSLALEAFYKSESEKPCIAPPIAGLNIPYTTYKVKAEFGGKLDFKTGSKLDIPKNAFVDEKGNLIQGEVELRYREFHDQVDFFLSGIPMTYDSGGVRYHFESAGMMQMLAYQDGKEVALAKGKTINVELASQTNDPKFNLYILDTVKNNWACLGKDKIVAQAKQASAKADTIARPIVRVQETPKYLAIESKKALVQKEIDTKIAALPKMEAAPLKPVKSRKEKYTFNLEVDSQEYPELAIYKGLLFEVGDENKNFSRDMYDITWDAATIKEGNKKGENYALTLEKGPKKYNLVVYPVFEGKNYEVAMKEFQNKFTSYNALLSKRLEKEQAITAEYAKRIQDYKNEQIEYERQYKAEQARLFKEENTESKVCRVFSISKFGVYNCDCPNSYPQGVLCSANLLSENEKPLKAYTSYLVDKQRNGLFTYTRNPISTFSFNPKSQNLLWTVENGRLYYLKSEDFASISSGDGLRKIKMNLVEQKFENPDEMKIFFGI